MMYGHLYVHKRTGVMYRTLFQAFSVELQCQCVIYISLSTGQVFSRNEDDFMQNFELRVENVQEEVTPKDPTYIKKD